MKRDADITMAQPYVFHVISATTPPAYSETPCDDLVAELAKMKAMMEQMRLDKERLEIDAKRYEMDAKRYEMEVKRKEEEAAMALRMEQEREMAIKEKKELDAVFSLFHDTPRHHYKESNMDFVWKYAGEEEHTFLKSLEASGETILLATVDRCGRKCDDSNTSEPHVGTLQFILTNCHLYYCSYKWVKTNPASKCRCGREGNCVGLNSETFYATTLYSFTNPLKLVHAKILLSIIAVPERGDKWSWANKSIWERIYNLNILRLITDASISDSGKKFESIIRLIPGSYKNGNWRQLDGFFGMYFNEETMEVSEVPPPL
jgi:hypothetical protein